jgi:hypothetical protein
MNKFIITGFEQKNIQAVIARLSLNGFDSQVRDSEIIASLSKDTYCSSANACIRCISRILGGCTVRLVNEECSYEPENFAFTKRLRGKWGIPQNDAIREFENLKEIASINGDTPIIQRDRL